MTGGHNGMTVFQMDSKTVMMTLHTVTSITGILLRFNDGESVWGKTQKTSGLAFLYWKMLHI